jgi:hypothetical protein
VEERPRPVQTVAPPTRRPGRQERSGALDLKHMATDALTRQHYVRRGITLEYLTITWNVLECLVAVVAGLVAGSVAPLGFGVDSAIESAFGSVLLWRLHAERCGKHVETLERRALKLVGLSFLLWPRTWPTTQR